MDENNDGVVTKEEALQALAKTRMREGQKSELVEALIGESDAVSYTAFMGQLLAEKREDTVDHMWKIFKELDLDDNGYLDRDEIGKMLERKEVKEAMKGMSQSELMERYGWGGKE